MNRNLPNKTDDFFLQHLKDYSEEPANNVWKEIDKKLSGEEKANPAKSTFFTFCKAAAIVLLLIVPLLLIDSPLRKNATSEEIKRSNAHQPEKLNNYTSTIPARVIKNAATNIIMPAVGKNLESFDNLSQSNFSIAEIPSSIKLKNLAADNKQGELIKEHTLFFLKNDSNKNDKENDNKAASTIIKFPGKHSFYINPFFSADHISGRSIEQYEFDNLSKNDYDKRESPDMSFTAGIYVSYQLSKKYSLLSGVSFSNSNLSITTTAVKALADASGVYKFKLATSYGLAEINKSGITPNAGDSLLVSSASMQFNYISLPLLISYNIGGKKIKYSVHGGFAINKLLSEKVEAEYEVQNKDEDETINKIEGIRKTFFTLNTGVEVKYSLSKKIDISVSPELRYGINSINKKTPIKTYPVNYGLSLNAYFKL